MCLKEIREGVTYIRNIEYVIVRVVNKVALKDRISFRVKQEEFIEFYLKPFANFFHKLVQTLIVL